MTNQHQGGLQLLATDEQHQLDGGVYLYGPDIHISPPFRPTPIDPTNPSRGMITPYDGPMMITHGGVSL